MADQFDQEDPLGILEKKSKKQEDPLGILKKKSGGVFSGIKSATSGLSGGSGLTPTGNKVDGIPTVTIGYEKDGFRDGLPETQADIDRRNKENELSNLQSTPEFQKDPLKTINKFISDQAIQSSIKSRQVSQKESTGQKFLKPENEVDEEKINEYNYQNLQKGVRETMFPLAKDARAWRQQNEAGNDNETAKLADEVIGNNKKIKDVVLATKGDLGLAAVQYYADKDPQVEVILKEGKLPPEETIERLKWQFLNDPKVKEALVDEGISANVNGQGFGQGIHFKFGDKNIREIYDEEKANFRQRNPLMWTNQIVQKIAQGREDYGYNNPFLNLQTTNGSDRVVERLYEDGKMDKADYQHYYDQVRPLLKMGIKKIPTPGFIENGIQSTVKSVSDLPQAVTELTGIRNLYTTPGERSFERLQEGENAVPFKPKGIINKISHATGNLAGVIIPIGGEAKLLRTANLIKNPRLAHELAMGLTFYHDIYTEAERKDPEGGLLNQLQATLQSVVFAKLNPMLGKLSGAPIKAATPEIRTVLKNLESEAITGATAKTKITDIVLNKIKGAANQSLSASSQMALAGMINDGISGVFTGKYDFDESLQTAAQTFKHLMLGTPLIGLLSTPGRKPMVAGYVYEFSKEPEKLRSEIESISKEDAEFAKTSPQLLKNLDHIVEVRKELDAMEDLKPQKKKEYLLAELQQKILADKVKSSPSKLLNTKEERQIAALEIEKQSIVDGDMGNQKIVEEFYNEELLPKGHRILLEDADGKFSPNKVGEYLKLIAQQTNGLSENWTPLESGKPKMEGTPDFIIEKANERWSKEIEKAQPKESKVSVIMPEENRPMDIVPLKKAETESSSIAVEGKEKDRNIYDEIFEGKRPEDMGFDEWHEKINEYRRRTGSSEEPKNVDKLNFQIIQSSKSNETPKQAEPNKKVTELEKQRDAEIEKVSKPEVKMEFVTAKELVDSKDPIGNKKIHTEIKDRYKKLRELLDCLHG